MSLSFSPMKLLPVPKKLEEKKGSFSLPEKCSILTRARINLSQLDAVYTLAESLEKATGSQPVLSQAEADQTPTVNIHLSPGDAPEAYSLSISQTGIEIAGQGQAGLHHGIQTLIQIIDQHGITLPCLHIEDEPDFPVRGLYFDISRGKIPTMKEFFRMVDRLSHYKMNQMQLYIEQTYAFKNHPDIWAGSDPLSAEDIRVLDAYCKKRHVELVPALSTFGHFAVPIKSKRKQHLNELTEDVSDRPFSWWERVSGYTLDISNKESIELVQELIEELIPLFSSPIFNICCDETWDLGKGKNRELAEEIGVGKVYLQFVAKITDIVKNNGKTPFLWGDVILNHPELVEEIPKGVIVLNYDTKKNSSPLFQDAGIDFYTCSQLQTSNKWVPRLENSTAHALMMTKQGLEYGAKGYLSNEWGDAGHINFFTIALHGMILGGSLAWNVNSFSEENMEDFDRALSVLEMGDPSGNLFTILRKMDPYHFITWHEVYFWIDPFIPEDWREKKTRIADSIVNGPDTQAVIQAYHSLTKLQGKLEKCLSKASPADALASKELRLSVRGALLMLEICMLTKRAAGLEVPEVKGVSYYETADKLRWLERDFCPLWHKRNKPSEYYRIKLALMEIATRLDDLA